MSTANIDGRWLLCCISSDDEQAFNDDIPFFSGDVRSQIGVQAFYGAVVRAIDVNGFPVGLSPGQRTGDFLSTYNPWYIICSRPEKI